MRLKVAERFFAGGAGASGKLGNGETLNKDHPVLVKMQNVDSSLSNLSNIVQITAGDRPMLAPLTKREKFFVGDSTLRDNLVME